MNSKKESVAANKGIGAFMKKRKLQIGVTTIICSTLTFNLAYAEDTTTETITEEIFHIYNDEEYIGAVTDEQKIDTLIATKKEEASTQYEDYIIDAGTNIEVVPEQVFTVAVDENQALQTLQQSIAIEAKATAIVVGGQTVAYVKDKADFDETIRQLKLLFVTEQQLDALNTSNNNVPPLQENETRIKSINITNNVTAKETMIDPEQIIEPQQLAKQLIEGEKATKYYPVQEGDTLQSIATSYGLTVNELVNLNSSLTVNSKLSAGETLTVEVIRPYVNVEVQYETKKVLTVGHKTIVKQSDSLLKGETEIEQQGKDGQRDMVVLLTEINGQYQSTQTLTTVVVVEPVDEVKVIGTKEVPNVGSGSFAWPAVGGYVSSKMGPRWGRNHDGIDIARPSDYTIKASDHGEVTFAGPNGTYGNKVVVSHNNGYETVYAHLASISVSVGQTVAQGQELGIMGNTGRSTGIHLHFEVYNDGALVNPLSVLNR